jgi:signal transduction histidine kinase
MLLPPTGPVSSSIAERPAGATVASAGERERRRVRLLTDAAAIAAVALSYFFGTRIGFLLTSGNMPIATFWPPNAILLAAFLLAPARLWWAFLLALVPAHFLAQAESGVPLATSFGWLVGNCGEALLGAVLISRFGGRQVLFQSVRGVTSFLLFGFILAPLVTTFLDAAIVVGTNWGRDYWDLWITRLLSNMLASLTIVPVIVAIGQRGWPWMKARPRGSWLEAALIGALVVVVSLLVFRAESLSRTDIPALIYLPLPLLLWSAMRFGPAGLSASLLTIAVVSIESLMNGRGPFISTSAAASVLSMQVFLCMIGVPLLLLAAVTMERRRTEVSLRETSRKLIDAQEHERQRIARELHDDIGQTLTLAEIELDRIITHNGDAEPGVRLNKLRDQMTMVSQGIWEISHGLYPSNLEILGLVTALHRLCSDLSEETRLDVQCERHEIPDHLAPEISLCLYRVAQEALQNIVRHSNATTASVHLRGRGSRLLLQVVDDGVGFDQARVAAGLGFASMRERLNAVNGGLAIHSQPGRGTRLDAWVVLRPVPAAAGSEPTIH